MTASDVRQCVVGVDGGGTRTRLLLADLQGRVLGRGESGPSNFHDVGADGVRRALADAFSKARREAQEHGAPQSACLALAGVADAEARDAVREVASALGFAPPRRVAVIPDYAAALAGGLAGRPGIVVVAGTGSVAYGRNEDGATHRAGGWGSVLDDAGSAHDVGRRALIATLRAADGRGPATPLTRAIERRLGVDGPLALALAAPRLDRETVAGLAPLVTEAAEAGDRVAWEIVEGAAEELALAAAAVARALGMESPDVTTAGGLLAVDSVREAFRDALAEECPTARQCPPRLPPVCGAVLEAVAALGGDVARAADRLGQARR